MRLGRNLARAIMLAAVMLLPGGLARAEINQQQANTAWRQADSCARDSFKKFPDHTPQGNAQRETARRECLRNHKLPAPAGVPQVSDAPPSGEPQ
jgi:hypothetical protein